MKNKSLLALSIFACLWQFSKAQQQVSTWYAFSASAGTYSTIANGHVLGSNNNDDDIFSNVPIGFNFNFVQQNLTQISVNANGYIKMGSNILNYSVDAIDDSYGDDSVICALSEDLQSNATGVLSYTTVGTAPNRIFVVDWSDYTSEGGSDDLYFQIRLHETSNLIEVAYGSFTLSQYSSAEVGLRGSTNTDFNSLAILSGVNTWSSPPASVNNNDYAELDPSASPAFQPNNNQVFTWTPPAACSGMPASGTLYAVSGTSACVGQGLTFRINGGTIATGLNYQWQTSTNGSSWSNATSGTDDAAFFVNYTAPLYYRVIVGCGASTATSSAVNVNTTPPIAYATVPFSESFDNTWQGRCDTRNVPNALYWQSNPTTGDSSWRRQDDGLSAYWLFPTDQTNAPESGVGCANFHTFGAADGTAGSMDLYVNMGAAGATYQLSLYHINMDGDDSLEVYLSTNGGTSFTKKTTFLSGDYNPIELNWNLKNINLGIVNSASSVLRFKAYSDFGFTDLSMDSMFIISCVQPTVTVTSATVCPGTPAVLTASGASTYSWSDGASGATHTVSVLASTNYTVTGTSGGCTDAVTASVSVLPGPSNMTVTTTNTMVCEGANLALFASGANTYTWSNGSNTPAQNITATSNTVYVVTGQTSNCSRTMSISIAVNPAPTIVMAATPNVTCAGDSVKLTASGALNYTWSANSSSIANTASLIGMPVNTTTYIVTGADANGCINMDTSIVSVDPLPVLSVPNVTFCSTNTGVITASGASSYTWSTGATGSVLTVNTNSNTTYTVTGRGNGCKSTATVEVIIGTAVSLSVTATNTNLCSGDTVMLMASGATTYLWDSTSTGASLQVSPLASTMYTVFGTNGTCSDTKYISLTVMASPSVIVSTNSPTLCAGATVTLNASGAFSYSWTTGTIAPSIAVSPSVTTTYTVVGTATNSCKSTKTITETVSICTGIEAISGNQSYLKVYPNPNSGAFVIQSSNANAKSIQVQDVSGRSVATIQSNQETTSIDISNLSNGIYFVVVKEEGAGPQTMRIVKE